MDAVKELGHTLNQALLEGNGMNDFLHRFLLAIGDYFSTSRLVVYDYDEASGVFDLLYFCGYPASARAEMGRRLHHLDVQRALKQRSPYWNDDTRERLVVPLYFQDTLEAILVLEPDNLSIELNQKQTSAFDLVSKFLGLFMSSNRLPVNQRQEALVATDIERAREVQMAYLPSEHPETERYEIFGYNLSSAFVGGDYFDYFCARKNSIQGVVADACGHGLAAALIMSTFRGLLHSEVHRDDDIDSLFTRLNRRLYTGRGCLQYLTAILFDYDEENSRLHYFNAGHFDPVIIRADGESLRLAGGGPPLGMFQESAYEFQTAQIAPGDLLVLFTDGLAELRNAEDEFFGERGILKAILDKRHLPVRELAADVLATATDFSLQPRPDDDLTLFLMRIH